MRSSLQDLLDKASEGTPLQLKDPKTGKVLHTLYTTDDLLPFEVDTPRFYVEDDEFVDSKNERLPLEEVRKALLLVARAARQKKILTVEQGDEDGNSDFSYTVVASPYGSVQYGCCRYTAAEVKEAAKAIREARRK